MISADLQGILLAILTGLALWLIKEFLQELISSNIKLIRKDLDNHTTECNKLPKSMIIESLNNVDEKVEGLSRDLREIRHVLNEVLLRKIQP